MEWDLEDLKQSIIDSAADYDKIMKEDKFIQSLISKGFVYDEDKDRWFRLWTTNNGQEVCLELYQKQSDGRWKQIMSGESEDSVFYEELV